MSTTLLTKHNEEDISGKLYFAWNKFVKQGIIMEEIVPHHIAESWHRSMNVDPSIDPYHNILSGEMLDARRRDNQDLISLAVPIMQDICSLGGQNFISLSDSSGYILVSISKMDLTIPEGTNCLEKNVGTNGIGTALENDDIAIIKGYEHYSSNLHTNICIAIPIHNFERIAGVINVCYPFGNPESGIIEMLKLGTKFLERQLKQNMHHSWHKEAAKTFGLFKDIIEQYVIVFDRNGKIVDANQKVNNLLCIRRTEEILGMHFGEIFRDKNTILSEKLPGDKLCLETDKCSLVCEVVKNDIIYDTYGASETVLIFEPQKQNTFGNTRTNKSIYIPDKNSILTFNELRYKSKRWSDVVMRAKKAAPVIFNVLIEGESGTGKEIIAHAMHIESGRKGPFIPINCGAIPKELIESELFGYEDGAFTGAKKGGMKGKFEIADSGTVLLDEIGEMPLSMQVRLLRFLQDKTIMRIGGTKPRTADVRIIAATNRDLRQEIKKGNFREDLYFRLNVINIHLPSLRERKEDIPMLVNYLNEKCCQQLQIPTKDIDKSTMQVLCKYNWPGNVRELNNVIENAIVFTEGNVIMPEVLSHSINDYLAVNSIDSSENKILKDYELKIISTTLEKNQGNVTKTAKELGIARSTLYEKLRKLNCH